MAQIWPKNGTAALAELIKATEFIETVSRLGNTFINVTIQYGQFVATKCVGTQHIVDRFCDFVGRRIGHELLQFAEEFSQDFVEYLHLFPRNFEIRTRPNAERFCQRLANILICFLNLAYRKLKGFGSSAFSSEQMPKAKAKTE